MIARRMEGWRNPARYLAPLALVAVAAVAYVIVHKAVTHNHTLATIPLSQPTTSSTSTTAGHHVSAKTKFYVVKPNDTLSKIAQDTGLSIATLERLNPTVNPDSLHVSQRLVLRR
jgi:LysM repeat protein